MHKKGKVIIAVIAGVAAVAIIGSIVISSIAGGNQAVLTLPNTTLKKGTLTSTVDASGNVESSETENVYTNLTYPIKEIKVELGDEVKAGDVLCVLDSQKLEESIERSEKNLKITSSSNYNSLKTAEESYLNYKNGIESGSDTQLNSADTQVITTKNALDTAQREYDKMTKELSSNEYAKIIQAKNNVESAYNSLEAAKAQYDSLLSKYDSDFYNKIKGLENMVESTRQDKISNPTESNIKRYNNYYDDLMTALPQDLLEIRKSIENSQTTYDNAVINLNETDKSIDSSLEDLEKNLNAAQKGYNDAVAAQKAAKTNSDTELDQLKRNYEQALQTVSDDPAVLDLANLKEDLMDCEVKAKSDGVVTAINCEEGQTPNGPILKVEDLNKLKVTLNVKEYDIKSISNGLAAKITCSSLGDDEFDGVVSSVAPAGVVNQNTGAIYYPVEVEITSKDTGLLLGANAKVDIICDKVDDAFSVPFGTVKVTEDGKDVIYIAEKKGDSYTAKEVPVTVGLQTDFEMQISSDELSDGTIVITDTEDVQDGDKINLKKKFTKVEKD